MSGSAGLSSVKCLVVEDNIMADGDDRDMCRLKEYMEKALQRARGAGTWG